jgi:hypothetical protein
MKANHATLSAACAAQTALLNGGSLVFYDGTRPANGDAAVTGSNHVLATLTFGNPAFGTPTAAIPSVATANAITAGVGTAAAGAGTVTTFALAVTSGGAVVANLAVSTSASDVVIGSTTIIQGYTVSCSSCTWTQNDQNT